MVPGRPLDAATLCRLLMERDRHIQRYQQLELTLHSAAGSFAPEPDTPFVWDLGLVRPVDGAFILSLKTTAPKPLPIPEGDQRNLAFNLQAISSV